MDTYADSSCGKRGVERCIFWRNDEIQSRVLISTMAQVARSFSNVIVRINKNLVNQVIIKNNIGTHMTHLLMCIVAPYTKEAQNDR